MITPNFQLVPFKWPYTTGCCHSGSLWLICSTVKRSSHPNCPLSLSVGCFKPTYVQHYPRNSDSVSLKWSLDQIFFFKFTGDDDGQSGLKTAELENNKNREASGLNLHLGHSHSLITMTNDFTKFLKRNR